MNKIILQKKLLNFLIFKNLLFLNTKKKPDPKKTLKKQNKRIKKLVKKAYSIPFYKERFDKSGVKPEDIKCASDFSKLPVLTKEDLRNWMNSITNDPKYKDYYHDTTSGSTGTPLTILYSPKEKSYNMANWFRVLLICGCNPFIMKQLTRADAHSATRYNVSVLSRIGILRRCFIQQYIPQQEMIDEINRIKPDILSLNKAEMMRLGIYCKNNNVFIYKPKFYTPIGEKIDEPSIRVLREVFGDGLIDAYGSAETGSIMFKTLNDEYYFINSDLYSVNVYNENNELSNNGRLIITPLFKTDLPIINYEIGDTAETFIQDGLRYAYRINGRSNDFIKIRDGAVVSFFELAHIFSETDSIHQIKIIQNSYEKLTVLYVRNKDGSFISDGELENYLNTEFNKHFNNSFTIVYKSVEYIEASNNGKIRVIECEV